MKTMTILRSTLGLATVLCATLGVGVTAEASSTCAFAGQPQNPADYGCFTNSFGTVTNNCSATETFCVPLLSETADHTVEITVYEPAINDIGCYAYSVYADGGMDNSSGPPTGPSAAGTNVQIVLPSTNVPSQGGLFACCNMAQGSRIDTIQF